MLICRASPTLVKGFGLLFLLHDFPKIVQSILAKGLSINLPYKAIDDGDFLPFYTIHYSLLPHYNLVHQLYEQFTVKLIYAHGASDKRNPLMDVVIDFL